METTMQGTDRFGGSVADHYSHWLNSALDEHFASMQCMQARQIVEALLTQGDLRGTLVDVGFGTGLTTKAVDDEAANVAWSGKPEYVVFDPSHKMCEHARKTLLCGLINRIKIVEEPGTSIEDHCFNPALVFTAHTLHNMEKDERLETICAVGRALRAGRYFSIVDKVAMDDLNEYNSLFVRRLEQIDRFFRGIGEPKEAEYWVAHELDDHRKRYTMDALRAMLLEAQFRIVDEIRSGPYVKVLALRT